ncbi:MAG: YggT family protein [Alphaproteobacteria bacterium]|nr:MAG: YggT family protein [Alphaproteobacteria bacterium]
MLDLYNLIAKLLGVYQLIIFVWVVLGWLQMYNALPYSRPLHMVMEILYRLTEPVLGFFRRFLPPMGGLDLSPLIAILGIEVLIMILPKIML